MKQVVGTLALFGALTCSLFAQERPNIIYILCDDLGIGDVGIHHPEGKIPTPHIDQLGREGMVFTDAHANASVCTPTRYGILTGRYAWRSRLKRGVLGGYSKHLIEPGRLTVPSLLQQHGYHTAGIGKWHLGWDWARKSDNQKDIDYTQPIKNGPVSIGFDYFFGHAGSLDMPPYVWIENNRPTAVPDRITVATVEQDGFSWRQGPTAPDFDHREVMDEITDRSVARIQERARHEQPFFLYVSYASPHAPLLPSEPFVGSSGLEHAFADFVTMNDAHVGKIVAAVEKAGIAENTLIIFTSDNGCPPAPRIFAALEALGHHPSAHYRGFKGDIYEGGHRIPFIARWPARIRPGSVNDDTICLTDLLATCADMLDADLPADAGEDSVSILPALLGTAAAPLREATVHHSIYGTFAIRKGPWKLVDAPHSGGRSFPKFHNKKAWADLPAVQLYHLESDPGETTNLQDKHPEVVQRLSRLLQRYQAEGRSTPLPGPTPSKP